jgi:PHD/YefM family antitoxin component YafN of YafNO toxin-antitoxin module
MKTVEVPSENKQLRRMVKQAQNDPLLLTQRGKPVAALVSVQGADQETLSLSTNPKFLRILRKSFQELDRGSRISLAEMHKRVIR